jgi:hypothetical protein
MNRLDNDNLSKLASHYEPRDMETVQKITMNTTQPNPLRAEGNNYIPIALRGNSVSIIRK